MISDQLGHNKEWISRKAMWESVNSKEKQLSEQTKRKWYSFMIRSDEQTD